MRDFAAQNNPSSSCQNSYQQYSKIDPPIQKEIKAPKPDLANLHPELIQKDTVATCDRPHVPREAINPTTPSLQPVVQNDGIAHQGVSTQTAPPDGTISAPNGAPISTQHGNPVSDAAPVTSSAPVTEIAEPEEPKKTFGEKVKDVFSKIFTVFKAIFSFLKDLLSFVFPFLGKLAPLFNAFGGGSNSSSVNSGSSPSFPTGGSNGSGTSATTEAPSPARDAGTTFLGNGTGSLSGSPVDMPAGPVLDRPRIIG